jgi:hypothetical protein
MGDRFAPTTEAIGFVRAPLAHAADTLARWRRELDDETRVTPVRGSRPELLGKLEPLTGAVRPRELLVATAGDWTAYFDCGLQGGDPVSVVRHLALLLGTQGVAAAAVPDTIGDEVPGRFGSIQFELFGPERTYFLNYVRTVSVVNDGGNWRCDAAGDVQPFEEPEDNHARRTRDRFSLDMLASYCAALGIEPFGEDFYLDDGVLTTSPMPVPDGQRVMTIAEAQRYWGIRPQVR